jgi:hypothetical protein
MKGKDRVRRHGALACDVTHAKALQIDRAAMLLDQDGDARQLSCCNLVVEELGNELQLLRCRRGRIGGVSCPACARSMRHESSHQGEAPSARGSY